MSKTVIDDTKLVMRQRLKLQLVSQTRYSPLFLDLYKKIEVSIGGSQTKRLIFVVEVGGEDLVLGQLFLITIKFSKKYKLNGVFGFITFFKVRNLLFFKYYHLKILHII